MALPQTTSSLDTLANQMPVANQRRQQQQQAATALQMQQAVKQAGTEQITPMGRTDLPTIPSTGLAQGLGGAAAQQTGQAQVAAQKQNVQEQAQLGGMALDKQQQDVKQKIASLQQGVQAQAQSQEQQLANLSQDAKKEMYDSRLQFQRDENNRISMNERQLADYAVLKAQNQQQYAAAAQHAQQLHDMKITMLEAAANKLDQELKSQFTLGQQAANNQLKIQLTQALADAREAARQEANRRHNNMAAWQAGGQVVGAVVGGIIGGGFTMGMGTAVGAGVGAQVGGAIGGAIGSANS